jgi:hypothetical protein
MEGPVCPTVEGGRRRLSLSAEGKMDDSVLSMDGDKTTKWSVTFIRANVLLYPLYHKRARKASRGLVISLLHRLMQGGERSIIRPCAAEW